MMRSTRSSLVPRLIACAFAWLGINATNLLGQSLELGSPVTTFPESTGFSSANADMNTPVNEVGLRTAAPSVGLSTERSQVPAADGKLMIGSVQADSQVSVVGNQWATLAVVGLIVACAVCGAIVYFRRAKSWSEQLILLQAGRSVLWPKDLRTLRQLASAIDVNPSSLLTSRAVFEYATKGSTESHIERLRVRIFGR
jgi:hypothetical protein